MGKVLKIRDRGDAVVATPNVAKFDLLETDSFRDELEPVLSSADDKPLLLDLSRVEFVTSATLGVMADLVKQCRAKGRPLALVGVRPKVLEVLRISHLDHLFSIHDSEDDALASL
jgi:anti-sigma B factor antagonist